MWKHGGPTITKRLHELICRVWEAEEVPQQWKKARLVFTFKKKGDRDICENSRDMALLSVAGKILPKIMLIPLNPHIVDSTLPESQCGFLRERGTTDMIFVARQLQEKYREQRQNFCLVFVDLSKAFETVNREILWEIMRRLGCPSNFTNIVRAFHAHMSAIVVVGGKETEPFVVGVEAKQGCVMAPVIFKYTWQPLLTFSSNVSPRNRGLEQGTASTEAISTSIDLKQERRYPQVMLRNFSMRTSVRW